MESCGASTSFIHRVRKHRPAGQPLGVDALRGDQHRGPAFLGHDPVVGGPVFVVPPAAMNTSRSSAGSPRVEAGQSVRRASDLGVAPSAAAHSSRPDHDRGQRPGPQIGQLGRPARVVNPIAWLRSPDARAPRRSPRRTGSARGAQRGHHAQPAVALHQRGEISDIGHARNLLSLGPIWRPCRLHPFWGGVSAANSARSRVAASVIAAACRTRRRAAGTSSRSRGRALGARPGRRAGPGAPSRPPGGRLHRVVVQVEHAQDDGLAVQRGEHRAVQAGLGGLDRHLVGPARGQLGQERVAGRGGRG